MAAEDLLSLLQQGSPAWNQWRTKTGGSIPVDLTGADLRGMDLSGTNLQGGDLAGASA
jgi:uncharacterized protein YjbI with pentapeptide repeats